MNVKPYKIFNKSEMQFLTEHLSGRLQSWAKSWAPSVEFSLSIDNANDQVSLFKSILQSENKIDFTNGEDYLAVAGWGEDFISKFPVALYSNDLDFKQQGKASSLLKSFTIRAIEELVESLCQNEVVCSSSSSGSYDSAGSCCSESCAAIISDIETLGVSGISIVVQVANQKLYLLLNTNLALNILLANGGKTKVDEKITLAKRSSGLGKEAVHVELAVGEAEIEFGSLQSLAVGDVITFEKIAADAFDVQVVDGDKFCKGYLGTKDSCTSVQLIRG